MRYDPADASAGAGGGDHRRRARHRARDRAAVCRGGRDGGPWRRPARGGPEGSAGDRPSRRQGHRVRPGPWRAGVFATAGIAHSAPFLEHPEAQWHRVLRVNLTGVFLCGQAAARQMVRQGGGGRIIATASINGFRGVENLVGYNAAKAGVIELTRTMAVELAQHRITVNAIAPAQIDTRLTRTLPEEARRRRVERIPMGRFGEPEEVAKVALFLASDDASYVTGHTLAVDGGYLSGGLCSGAPVGVPSPIPPGVTPS